MPAQIARPPPVTDLGAKGFMGAATGAPKPCAKIVLKCFGTRAHGINPKLCESLHTLIDSNRPSTKPAKPNLATLSNTLGTKTSSGNIQVVRWRSLYVWIQLDFRIPLATTPAKHAHLPDPSFAGAVRAWSIWGLHIWRPLQATLESE